MTTDFLANQPEILFEASSLHEVCHIMNDDLAGHHRKGANIEAAEEHCVLQAVGEACHQQYLRTYATYQHWDSSTYDRFLQKVKAVVLVGAPTETDNADRSATDYFKKHSDGIGMNILLFSTVSYTMFPFIPARTELGMIRRRSGR